MKLSTLKLSSLKLSTVASLTLLLAASGLCACRRGASQVGTYPNAPVILISIDTLRSDRLPAYGYKGIETPAIDALRRDGVLFERAYTQYPVTLPSHSTILTGLLPAHHGVRDNLGYELDTDKHPYLPRLLKERGYTTAGVVSSFVLRGSAGLAHHFDLYDDAIEAVDATFLGNVQRSGEESRQIAGKWLDSIDAANPFFLFFHIYEPHTPYEPPEPFASRYKNAYDGEVATADSVVGRLLDDLKQRGIYDRAVIVLLSDHGEGLGEHGEQGHGILLYREVLQVPLIVKLPGAKLAGTSVGSIARLVDVMPTLLDLVGATPPQGLDGRDLFELLDPKAPPRSAYSETFYARLHMGWSELESLISGPNHYIHGPRPELFDLAADPDETKNLLTERRRVFSTLRAELMPMRVPLQGPGAVDEETKQRLAALGYLGTTVADRAGPRADPRDHIPLLRQVGDAHVLMKAGRNEEAVAILQRVLTANPEMQDAWLSFGMALSAAGRLPESIEAYRRGLELSGPVPELTTRMASLFLRMGDLDQAEAYAKLSLKSNSAWSQIKLTEVALARDDLKAAEEHARAAVAERGKQVLPLILLTRVLLRRGNLAEAGATVKQIDQEVVSRTSQKELPGLHFLRGDLAAREGRLDEARQQLELEVERHPDFLDAYARLAYIYALSGDNRATADILRRMVDRDGGRSATAYALAVLTLRGLGDQRSADGLLAVARQRFPNSDQLRALSTS